MAGIRTVLALVVVVAAGCGDAPADVPDAADLATSCPADPIEAGAPCALAPAVRCLVGDADCSAARVCRCEAGHYACEQPDFEAPCDDIEDATCSIEGVYGCTMYPTSGTRWCQDGVWKVDTSCPDGCPGPDSVPPETGDACSVAAGEVCPYDSTQCECVDSEFRCCDYPPCDGT